MVKLVDMKEFTGLTNAEITLAVRDAYEKLPPDEKANVKRIANNLILKMKAKYGKDTIFGMDSALELIACMGMAMNDNRLRTVK